MILKQISRIAKEILSEISGNPLCFEGKPLKISKEILSEYWYKSLHIISGQAYQEFKGNQIRIWKIIHSRFVRKFSQNFGRNQLWWKFFLDFEENILRISKESSHYFKERGTRCILKEFLPRFQKQSSQNFEGNKNSARIFVKILQAFQRKSSLKRNSLRIKKNILPKILSGFRRNFLLGFWDNYPKDVWEILLGFLRNSFQSPLFWKFLQAGFPRQSKPSQHFRKKSY